MQLLKVNESEDMIIKYVQRDDDELLTRKELCERILNCDVDTANKYYINRSDFPYMYRGNQKIYPKRAVEEWIEKNTHYRD